MTHNISIYPGEYLIKILSLQPPVKIKSEIYNLLKSDIVLCYIVSGLLAEEFDLQRRSEIIGTTTEKRCCSGSHKQCKTLLKDHMVRLKIISLYIYKDLRLKILGLMSHEDGNLVPSPRCGYSFEVAFQL